MVLIFLLYKCFIVNLLNFPNHVIHVCKLDVLHIKKISMGYKYIGVNLISSSTVDLSKLEIFRKFKFSYNFNSIRFN